MIIKQYEDFYKEYSIKIQFDKDNMPIINGIDCLCNYPERGLDTCGYKCHDGTKCKLYIPRTEKIAKIIGTEPSLIDWDKEYIKII